MEIKSQIGGDSIQIQPHTNTDIGRREYIGFRRPSAVSGDRTISRRHLSLLLVEVDGHESKVKFHVIGKNPVVVCREARSLGDGEAVRIYRNEEQGELRDGDRFSLSIKDPAFWVLSTGFGEEVAPVVTPSPETAEDDERGVWEAVARRERRTMERREKIEIDGDEIEQVNDGKEGGEVVDYGELEVELRYLDVSSIDPVREFGFLVKGHEFDCYLKQKIRPARGWSWYLQDPEVSSSDNDIDVEENGKNQSSGGTKLKRKVRMGMTSKGRDNEDEEWTGGNDNDNDKDIVGEVGSGKRVKYSTRLRDLRKTSKNGLGGRKRAMHDKGDDESEEDETLGGFIVENEEVESEEEMEEEEEEFDDDDEEDD